MFHAHNRLELVLSRAVNAHFKGDLQAAKNGYLKVLAKNPKRIDLLNNTAKVCAQLHQYGEATSYMRKVLELSPNDDTALVNCAFMEQRLGALDSAEEKLLKAIEINPKNFEAFASLTALLSAKNEPQKALKSATAAMTLDPASAKASNNLGTVLQKLGDTAAAKISFETALILDPNFEEALFNLATLESFSGNTHKAIELFEAALKNITRQEFDTSPRIKYALSYEYLRIGRLGDGWDNYDYGFHPMVPFEYRRAPNRTFPAPLWKGEDLIGKRLLVWGEQGIGDELLFMSCLPDLAAKGGTVIIECEYRLVQQVARSFPSFIVRAHNYKQNIGLTPFFEDYDYHVPMGSLMRIYRRKLADFQRSGPYLIVNSEKAMGFETRLSAASTARKRVGICWRSGKLDGERNISYTSLIDWGSIFSVPDCDFINLQYGECEQELAEAESKFGIRILRWSDIDLKNDFDSTLSLISRLDVVVTVATAVSPMAAAIGVRVLLLSGKGWPNLGTDHYPFFPTIQCIFPPEGSIIAECLFEATNYLKKT
jgi:tetratricopeptide (TPR) repeat protein